MAWFQTALLKFNILRLDGEAFVLIFPDGGGIELEKLRHDVATGEAEETLRFIGGIVVGLIVIARAAALAVVPMRDGMDGAVADGPSVEFRPQGFGNLLEGHKDFV